MCVLLCGPTPSTRERSVLRHIVARHLCPPMEVPAPAILADPAAHDFAMVWRTEVLADSAVLPAVGMILIHRDALRFCAVAARAIALLWAIAFLAFVPGGRRALLVTGGRPLLFVAVARRRPLLSIFR